MPPSVLTLCARIKSHSLQRSQLLTASHNFQQWDDLLLLAEKHGMGPLLHMHLTAVREDLPDTFLRGLRFLCLRHQRANEILSKSLGSVLSLLETKGIPSLVLKGAALCQALYPKMGLRPMRDIDLFLAQEDVEHVHCLLQQKGFRVGDDLLPDQYFHLPPLFQNIDGLEVCLELHHGLFPKEPPYYQPLSFAELHRHAQSFEVDGREAYALANEEMLWHLFQHGFHAPLTYEPYKLISAADIVGLVESQVDTLDWEKIRKVYPQLFRALPLFHHLTPWHDAVLRKIPNEKGMGSPPPGVGDSYKGWPRSRFGSQEDKKLIKILQNTILPSRWWLMLYYSTGESIFSILWCRLILHPLHILRWVKTYGIGLLRGKRRATDED